MKSFRMKGQGLVEFALILPALLMILFAIIEGAFLFQAYLAVQHAAREGARYATAYQPPRTYSVDQGAYLLTGGDPQKITPAYPNETPDQWNLRRAGLIRERAFDQSMGIRILTTALGNLEKVPVDSGWLKENQPGFFGVRVRGVSSQDGTSEYDHPGLPGLPIEVEVRYRWAPLDPIIGAIVPNGVLLTGRATMINEGIQVGMGAVAPPTFPPPATSQAATPTPTGAWTPIPGSTATATPTKTPTPTPVTPTPTPNYPYIVLVPKQDRWLIEEWDTPAGKVPAIDIELYNHPGTTTQYRFFWNDGCGGPDVDLGFSRTTSASGYAIEPVRAPSQITLSPSASYYANYKNGQFSYLSLLCGDPPEQGKTYTGQLKTKKLVSGKYEDVASVSVPLHVPFQRPDLIITDIILPDNPQGGAEARIGVVVSNTESVDALGTFDVDIYINPSHEPVLKGLPGLGTAGDYDSAPKQWEASGIPKSSSKVFWYVVTFPSTGELSIWAQVDTSDIIDEKNDENNIYGPEDLTFPCSDKNDNFDLTSIDPKWWPLASIGEGCSGDGGESAYIGGQGLMMNGVGCDIFSGAEEGHFYFLHQGPESEDFDIKIQVLAVPQANWTLAGLMVRESLDPLSRFAAVSVGKNSSGNYIYRFYDRVMEGVSKPVENTSCRVSISSSRFTGANPPGVWVRIVKEANKFTKYVSLDGVTWTSDATCTTITFDTPFSQAYPGVITAPN